MPLFKVNDREHQYKKQIHTCIAIQQRRIWHELLTKILNSKQKSYSYSRCADQHHRSRQYVLVFPRWKQIVAHIWTMWLDLKNSSSSSFYILISARYSDCWMQADCLVSPLQRPQISWSSTMLLTFLVCNSGTAVKSRSSNRDHRQCSYTKIQHCRSSNSQ